MKRLGINIDHVATIRNARGEGHPNILNAAKYVMKLGADGFICYETKDDGFVNRQYYPALNVNPLDVTGAGDSLIAGISAGICSGLSIMRSSALGALIASLAVQNMGNIPINKKQLENYIREIQKYE